MNKRVGLFFIMIALMTTILFSMGFVNDNKAFADTKNDLNIQSKCAYLKDYETGTVIFKQNETERRPIASMCKIMTLLLTFENIDNGSFDMDTEVIVSENAAGMGGSQVFLESNAPYKVSELIKSIVVASANDASVAIAEKIAGSEESFVALMNEKAKNLGMDDTVFVNCTGLPKIGQFSCAKDVATMFGELLKHDDYYKFSGIWMDEVLHPEGRKTQISNTNKLIRFYEGCDAGKTGYTSEAGHCVCVSAKRNDTRLISVIIKGSDSKSRFKDASNLLNYGFNNYENRIVVDTVKLSETVKVNGGKVESVGVIPEKRLTVFAKKGEKRALEVVFNPKLNLCAPVKLGESVGEINVFENGKLISSVNAVATENVLKANIMDNIKNITSEWSII
ncbi:MAG: D-alanyl-D-alanine carboxypeptidase family protein [Clostridia bacterium]|nr:D-alanyl-D-alanine carboxypeptidase family protein [Clostridia bacterium]